MPTKKTTVAVMSADDLNTSLRRANAALSPDLRKLLAPENLRPQFPNRAGARQDGRKPVRAKKLTPKRALLAYGSSPFDQITTALLHAFISKFNEQIPNLARSVPIEAFGDANNHLDPLQFHGQIAVDRSGEVCLPRACTSTPFGFEICVPPFPICASGEVEARLDELRGLSTMTIRGFDILRAVETSGTPQSFHQQCYLQLHMDNVTAVGSANAHGGPFGIRIPAGASAAATIDNVRVQALADVTFDVQAPRIVRIELNRLHFRYDSLSVGISGLGPFNRVADLVADKMKSRLESMLDLDGPIPRVVRSALQKLLDRMTGWQS